jgi:hypothetical protein
VNPAFRLSSLRALVASCAVSRSVDSFKLRSRRLRLGQKRRGRRSPVNIVLRPVKTTVEIPDDLFRRAKVLAAQEGLSMKQLITESLQYRVLRHSPETTIAPWKQAFGAMRAYKKENRRIEKLIEVEFGQ